MWELYKKERLNSSIEELKKKKKLVTIIRTFYAIIIIGFIIGTLYCIYIGGIMFLLFGLILTFFLCFELLWFIDACNDIDRINMWIFLKQKLGE